MFCRINFNLQNYTYFGQKTKKMATIVINNVRFFPKLCIFLVQYGYNCYPKQKISRPLNGDKMSLFENFYYICVPKNRSK